MDPTEAPDLPLDDRTQAAFLKWFRELEAKQDSASSTVRFFDRKDCFSVHGESALFIARQFYKTTAVVKYLGGAQTGLPGVTLNRNLYETVLRELLVERAEHSVELYEGSGCSWTCTKSASPGKLGAFEEDLFRNTDMSDVPVVMAASVSYVEGARTVGVAFADASSRRLGACEFADDERFCMLETVVVQLGVKECVLPKEAQGGGSTAADYRRLRDVLSRCNALASERDRGSFNARNIEADLGRLLREGNTEQHREVLERTQATAALAAVLAFTEVTADTSSLGKYSLSLYNPGRYMRLDSAAQRALNVMKTKLDANDNFSLYGLMNRARTAMGKRLLKVWLKQPLLTVAEISERHDLVESFATDPALRERLRDQCFRGMPDVERLVRRLDKRQVGLADLCQLYRASSKLPAIQDALRSHEGPHAPLLVSKYADVLVEAHDEEHLTKFEELLEAAVDLDRIPDEYLICAAYNKDLQVLAADKSDLEAAIEKAAYSAAKDLGLLMDKTIRLDWHKVANTRTRCLRITQKEEKTVRKKLQAPPYQTLETRKDGTKFTNTALKSAAARLQGLSKEYDSLQQALVDQVVGVAQTFVEVWEQVAALLAELDVLLGFAELSVNAPTPYVRPTMLPPDAGELTLIGSRHPNVEAQDNVSFIPNDCKMVKGKSWFQIITGPNMGGKSTFIRQVGAVVLMAQVGCFVPCSEARIAVRDCIFARVGAGDCQLRGVSTFMAEMLETAAILKGATAQSLVIIDELGRGTSTYDGFGLAWAISEHLMECIGCPTLFATHFHELTALEGEVGVANQHVEIAIDRDSGKLTMLYQVNDGPCDQSFGIHVAEFAHFPATVVELAKRKAEELEDFSEPRLPVEVGVSAPKRKRVEASDADAGVVRARAFLQELAALPLDAMPAQQAVERTRQLYAQLQQDAAGLPALQQLLQAH